MNELVNPRKLMVSLAWALPLQDAKTHFTDIEELKRKAQALREDMKPTLQVRVPEYWGGGGGGGMVLHVVL